MYAAALWTCAAFSVVIFGVLLYSVATFRKTSGPSAAAYRHSTAVEVLWALIPIVILVSAAAPAVRDLMDPQARTLASVHEPSQPTAVR